MDWKGRSRLLTGTLRELGTFPSPSSKTPNSPLHYAAWAKHRPTTHATSSGNPPPPSFIIPFHLTLTLRSPETVESLFIAFRLTGDVRYRNQGWSIFQAIEKHCKVETGGYASILNVDAVPVELEDKMETFLMVSPLV